MVAISDRDKKMIISNFMEELYDKHQNAKNSNLPTEFNLKDLYSIRLFNKYLSSTGLRASSVGIAILVLDTLSEYAETKGFLEIEGDIVRLTKKGLLETQKLSRDWD
jgi:hypothetical protein